MRHFKTKHHVPIPTNPTASNKTGVSLYHDDYTYTKKKKTLPRIEPSLTVPIEPYRRNKPNPGKNFLDPKVKQPTMKDKHLEKEVRWAVRDYLDELITNRKGPGKGMAVSSNELLAAARTAGEKFKKKNDNPLVDIAKQGLSIIGHQNLPSGNSEYLPPATQTVPGPRGSSYGPQHTANRAKANKTPAPRRHRSEYHWSVWKTTPTPAPSIRTPYPQAINTPTPAPPRTPKPETPIFSPTPAPIALKVPTPEPFRTPSVFRTIEQDQMSRPMAPVLTPDLEEEYDLRHITQTPLDYKADALDNMSSGQRVAPAYVRNLPQPTPTFERKPNHGSAPVYEPRLQAWASNANDYERQVAYNMFRAMNSETPIAFDRYKHTKASKLRARAATPAGRARVYQSMPAAGIRTSVPVFDHESEEKYIRAMAHTMESQTLKPYLYTNENFTTRPKPVHLPRPYPPKEYTFESSCFMNSQPKFRSSFIINPEWVSETRQLKQNLKQARASANGMRYGSKKGY